MTKGVGVYGINSVFSSGSLVFYEKAVGRTATGDVFTIGTSQVTVGGTGQDVDFLVYLGSANNYFKLDCGAATAAFYGVDVTVTGDLSIATEDLALGDDCSLEFGASTDVTMTWLGSTNILAILPASDDTGAIQFGNGTKDIDVKIFLSSASNYVDFNVGDSQMAMVGVDITTDSPVVITNATATSSTSTGALIVTGGIATAADITCGDDLFMSNGGVINFNAGNVTITHSAGALACTGALTVSIATESTSTTTGALIVTGGIGFGGDMYAGDDIFLTSGAVLNFNAGNATITHSAGLLTFNTQIQTGGLLVDCDSLIELGAWAESTSAPDTRGIHLGNSKIRAMVVAANDGKVDPIKRIESSCNTFMQSLDWATGWSATALEGAFYGGFNLIATEDNMNVSGAGGWIYLNDESGYTGAGTAPVIGTDAGKWTFVCGLESWVAMGATAEVKACGVVCGLKLSNNFVTGSTTTGLLAAIYCETVDSVGYDVVYASNTMGNGFVASTANLVTANATTFAAMIVDIAGQKGYIPVYFDADWTSS